MKKIILGILVLVFGSVLNADDSNIDTLRQKCNSGNFDSCVETAFLYIDGVGVSKDYKKANDYFSKACDGGDARGCFNLGVSYRDGTGVKQDIHKALKYFDIACNDGSAASCLMIGTLYDGSLYNMEEYRIEKDYKKAFDSYQKACDLENGIGCYFVAGLFVRGKGVTANSTKALEYLDKACDFGFKDACSK